MKLIRKLSVVTVFASAFVVAGGVFFAQSALAASGKIYLSPSSTSVYKGSGVTFNVRISPGGNVDTVHIVLSYSTSRLQYISSSYSGSPFSTQLNFSNSSGTISFDQSDLGGKVSTDSFIDALKFKALVGSGSSSLSLTGSNAANAGSATNPSTSGASVTFKTASTSSGSSSSSTSTSSGTSTSTSSAGTSAKKATASKKATSIIVADSNVQYTLVTFKITSKDPTKVYIKYGLGSALTTSTKTSTFATSHSVTLDKATIVPGQTYSYVVVSTNKAGVKTTSKAATFTTKGLDIMVAAFDRNHLPLRNTTIMLHSKAQTAKTDGEGFASFKDVSPGIHHVSYASGGNTYEAELTIANNVQTTNGVQASSTQDFAAVFNFAQKKSGGFHASVWTILVVVSVLAAMSAAVILRRRLQFASFASKIKPVSNDPFVMDRKIDPDATAENHKNGQRVNNIPYPTGPQPGNTVEPHGTEEHGKDA